MDMTDTKPVTANIPAIVCNNDSVAAEKLVKAYASVTALRPELSMLFHVDGYSADQKISLCQQFYSARDKAWTDDLFSIAQNIGTIGFSFPTWRYISQKFNEASLIEQYGFTRLRRDTDVRDESLPFSNPDRDMFGAGFVYEDPQRYVEYRRAYVIYSDKSTNSQNTVLVRNSSYFFGRDRLEHEAYYSNQDLDSGQLQSLSPDSINHHFTPITNIAMNETKEGIASVARTLSAFQAFDRKLSQWLVNDGRLYLNQMLETMIQRQIASGRNEPPVYLGWIRDGLPPWYVNKSQAVNMAALAQDVSGHGRFVLLTGEKGDFPTKPTLF